MFVIVGCDSDLLVLQDAASVPVEAGVEDQVNLAVAGSYDLTIPGCTGPNLTPPRNVAVINLSVFVFAKHRLQMLIHFQECIMAANAAKIEVPQIKIFTALLSGLTRIIEEGGRGQLWRGEVISAGMSLNGPALTSTNQQLRCAAAECLRRI